MSIFEDFKPIVETVAPKLYFSTKFLINYVIPKEDSPDFGLPQKLWFRRYATIAPWATLGMLILIVLWPYFWVYRMGLKGYGDALFFAVPHIIVAVFCFLKYALTLLCALILKRKKRNPLFVLAITPFPALKGIAGLIVFNLFLILLTLGKH